MKIANAADLIICFWDGKNRGTKALIDHAKALKKKIYIRYI